MKRRRNRQFFLSAACILLSAACFLIGKYLRIRSNDFFRNLTIEAEGKPFEGQWIKSLFTEEPDENAAEESAKEENSFAAWTEFRNETIYEDFSGRSSNTDVIAVCGSSHHLLPFGKNLTKEDSFGCIIGKETAEKLFGSSRAEGKELFWGEQRWVVRGVVFEPADFLMVEAFRMADEIQFDRISIFPQKNEDKRLQGEKFISQHGLLAHILRFDYFWDSAWLKELIPGKWSDFDGWKQNFKEYKKAKELAESAKKSVIESVGFAYRKGGSGLVCCGILFLPVAGGYWCYSHQSDKYDTSVDKELS